MADILEPDAIVTSHDVISLCCGLQRKHFGRAICPPSFVVIASIFTSPKDQRKPGLNTVKQLIEILLLLANVILLSSTYLYGSNLDS